jgi:cytochrome b
MTTEGQPSTVRSAIPVWDALVRVGHWTLMSGVCAAWFLRDAGKWHEWIGYGVLAVIVTRIVWGFTGSHYACFAQFVRSPAATLDYSKQVLAYREPRHIGHNPLGGWMIVVLLATTLVVCVSGWLYTTDRFWGVAWVGDLHEHSTNVLLALAALHIGGVIFSSLHHGENLVVAMFTGRKRAAGPGDVT